MGLFSWKKRRQIKTFVDELVEEFDVHQEVLDNLGLTKEEAYFFHYYNPVHMYCRLREVGIEKKTVKQLVNAYEKSMYDGVTKFIGMKKQHQDTSVLEKTICLHQAFLRNRPIGEGYGDCSTCTQDSENNPKCRGYYPFTVYNFVGENHQ